MPPPRSEDAWRKETVSVDLITCEYPPDIGGVSDYTQNVARGLAAHGIESRVWTCRALESEGLGSEDGPILVNRSLGSCSLGDLWRTEKLWKQPPTRRHILLQWTPTGYGLRAMNVLVPLWIAYRVSRGNTLWVMFHEAFYDWKEPKIARKIASLIQRIMAASLVNLAKEVFVSTEYLTTQISRLRVSKTISIRHLPVSANILPTDTRALGDSFVPETKKGLIRIGHFGTFHPNILRILVPAIDEVLRLLPDVTVLLIGAGSNSYLSKVSANLNSRVTATGPCSNSVISFAISSCDLMLQPYPDGISTRRTTAMAALAHGKLLATTLGPATEQVWLKSKAITFFESIDPISMAVHLGKVIKQLRLNAYNVTQDAAAFYKENFSLDNMIAELAARITSKRYDGL